jgi:glycosyltransferase involved in cell wall biosynthesis
MAERCGLVVATAYREASIQHISSALARMQILSELYVPLDLASVYRRTKVLGGLGAGLQSLCRRRMFSTAATSTAPLVEAAYVASSVLSVGKKASLALRAEALDRAVRRRLQDGIPPLAVVGMPMSCASTFQWARNAGITTIFNHVHADLDTENKAFEDEAQRAMSRSQRNQILRERWSATVVERTNREAALADLILAPSRFVEADLHAKGIPEDRILFLPYGTDLHGGPMPHRDNALGPLRILYVGQVGYRKGLQYLLDAVAKMPSSQAELTIVGPIVNRSEILSDLPRNAKYLGKLSREALKTEYARADVFVLPSLAEGMALVVLEAMAFGLPVIITRECGYEGVVHDGIEGFVIPSRNSRRILQSLEVLLRDHDLRTRMSQASRRRAEDYTWERFESQLIEELSSRLPNLGVAT